MSLTPSLQRTDQPGSACDGAGSIVVPASFEQERAWIADRLNPGNPAWNLFKAVRFRGALDPSRLSTALSCVIRRHGILRTSLLDGDDGLVQVVAADHPANLCFLEVPGQGADVTAHARRLAREFVHQPFNLEIAPLWRTLLLKLGPSGYVLILCMHSAICDGARTLQLFLRELLSDYRSTRRAEAPDQYVTYARAQQKLNEAALERHAAYWRMYLADAIHATTLPVFRNRPPSRTFKGTLHRQVLATRLKRRIDSFSASSNASFTEIVLAGLIAVLHRYAGESTVTIGHSASALPSEWTRAPFGPISNLFVLYSPIAPAATFMDLLRQVSGRLSAAAEHREYPFQRMLRDLQIQSDPTTTPLFQIFFETELPAGEPPPAQSSDLRVDDFPIDPAFTAYELQVTLREHNRRVAVDWLFNPDIYTRETIEQVARHFVHLLAFAIEMPDAPVSRIPILPDRDKKQIMRLWNERRTPHRKVSVQTLFEEQARLTPNAVAVEFENDSINYEELIRRADRLASHIVSLNIEPGTMIGLCMDRSLDMIVSIVAIFKAGGVVVPLDAAYPIERLKFMLTDAGVGAIVTTRDVMSRMPDFAALCQGAVTIYANDRCACCAAGGRTLPVVAAESLAYCIYTSGSTGNPKGVLVEHAALCNLVAWHCDRWLVGVGVRTLLYSPISFDVAFHEIVVGLSSGATLIQVSEEIRVNPLSLLEFVGTKAIEKWYMPFVTLRQVSQAARTLKTPVRLRELIIGGEPLRITPEIREFARRTGCIIHNHYGSTECIDVTSYSLTGPVDSWPDVVPIGRTNVSNMNAFIVDSEIQLVPVGVVGEIYCAGDCLARGYLNRPELNAQRFLANPFELQGPRLYKMGDLGRYLPDGNIECLGRADDQLKIRGFRVEPREIEMTLASYPCVRECVVAVKRGADGGHRIVAYVVAASEAERETLVNRLLVWAADRLPQYMVPTAIVLLQALPLTPSGKVAVRELPEPSAYPAQGRPDIGRPTSPLQELVSNVWCELLNVNQIDVDRSFFELGGDSLLMVRAHQRLCTLLGRELSPVTLFKYPNVSALTEYLSQTDSGSKALADAPLLTAPSPSVGHQIAIVGMACRVPGAADINQFWTNLRNGVESVAAIPGSETFAAGGVDSRDGRWIRAGAFLPGIELFDAAFFGYSPAEAAVIDPQQRLFLECAWEACEDAGLVPGRIRERVGVYAGAALSTYLVNNVLPTQIGARPFLSHRYIERASDLRIEQGNARDHLPMRVSYKLDLRGPSVNVQSTCSTSLVAVHLACQAIRNGECDMALAGGVAIITPQNAGYLWREGLMLSREGHCRAFDAAADGTIFGNGLGIVVLKPLAAALADGDPIYATITGSAINNDGSLKVDYAGPNVRAQAEVIARAHADAGVSADQISYVEAHGTGTILGDPIEVAALSDAFSRTSSRREQVCALGSVKTNVGHLDEAAGVVGLIKTALALHHRQLPASVNFTVANPRLGLESTPFRVNATLTDWETPKGAPRRAGVSSFAMGGTNCHVVLEEAPRLAPREPLPDRSVHILPVSGSTSEALRDNISRYIAFLRAPPQCRFADVGFSAAVGRKHFPHRAAVVAADCESARNQLEGLLRGIRPVGNSAVAADPPIAFLFTGQGSQYPAMGRALYRTEPVFRAVIEECGLASLLCDEGASDINETAKAQPALFALGYGLYKLWASWGIAPQIVIGHSLGEIVAACASGILSVADGLELVTARGRLMQALPQVGMMVQVQAPADAIEPLLAGYERDVSIAAINGPNCTVISGLKEAVLRVCKQLEAEKLETSALNVSHAFHSPLMRPILEDFAAVARRMRYEPPAIDIVSNITGELASSGEMCKADYWVRQISAPVQYWRGLSTIGKLGIKYFVEVGPRPTLIGLGRRCLPEKDNVWLPSLAPKDPDQLLASLARLYVAGKSVDWSGFERPFSRRRVPLPNYAFQRRKHWLEPKGARQAGDDFRVTTPAQELQAAPTLPDRGQCRSYMVKWQPSSASNAGSEPGRWVVTGEGPLASVLDARLRERNELCDRMAGQLPRPDSPRATDAHEITRFVYVPPESKSGVLAAVETAITEAHTLIRAIASLGRRCALWIVISDAEGGGDPDTALAHSALLGIARVANVEHADLRCACIHVPALPSASDCDLIIDTLLRQESSSEDQLAIRHGLVLVPRLVELDDEARASIDCARRLRIRPDGTYLITGGTGGIGLRLALHVAECGPKRLILASRSGSIAAADTSLWSELLGVGVQVEVRQVDVADASQLSALLTVETRNELAGIFHCAGVIDDGILLNQTAGRLAKVLAPKVGGAWLLHQLTRDLKLDFFVMFSSIASLFGYGGQAGYAAANAFLDAFAQYRIARGLPALTVSWGSWAERGMTSRMPAKQQARLREEGESLIAPENGIAALAGLMQRGLPHAVVAAIDWKTFARVGGRQSMLVAGLSGDAGHAPQRISPDFATSLRELPEMQARASLRSKVAQIIGSILGEDPKSIDPTAGFQEMGIDSLGALDVSNRLQSELDLRLPATLTFDYPCLDDLVAHLEERYSQSRSEHAVSVLPKATQTSAPASTIAIVGMSCRFPGADTPADLWNLLAEGRDAVRPIPQDRWNVEDFYHCDADVPGKMYVREAGLIEGIDRFDPGFFRISPREATCMDPRHRLLLEVSWEAIESAGINPASLRGSDTGVYLGCDEFLNDYLMTAGAQIESEPYVTTGSTLSFSAGRISFKLGLQGPSMVLATACSSSLVALHTAAQALRQRECNMAIVGGAKLMFGPEETVQLCKLRALAADGRSKPFSAAADGYGRGEGCAVVLLKRLDQALADGNPILALIRGTAINHDGASAGLTVPNGQAQARLIAKALDSAGVRPDDVQYIEAHGTGTQLGDPIEVNALTQVFGAARSEPLYVGSVKANIGHLEEAAGLAGLIKVILSFRHERIPPQIHCDVLSDKIDWARSPVRIPVRGASWPPQRPRLAGVSSFGMSGTNAHVVLESYQESFARRPAHDQYIFCFSGRDEVDLRKYIERFAGLSRLECDACDVAYTLQVGRNAQSHRVAVVAPDVSVLQQTLQQYLRDGPPIPGLYSGAVQATDTSTRSPQQTPAVQTFARSGDWAGLAQLWCSGFEVQWHTVYAGAPPRRVVLPTYPFKRERLWPRSRERSSPEVLNDSPPATQSQEGREPIMPVQKITRPPASGEDGCSAALRQELADLLGMAPEDISEDVSFEQLGADSLLYMRLNQAVRDQFGIQISYQQLIEEVATLADLTTFVTGRRQDGGHSPPKAAAAAAVATVATVAAQPPARPEGGSSRSYRQILTADILSGNQQKFLADFVDRYSDRTRQSKLEAQRDRPFLANCRMPPFQPHTKELSYPIVVQRSDGARFWDLDGNEYIDISMGYGVHLFGHQPAFLVEALRKQLERGIHIGPQTDQAGRVARLLHELTGMPRVAFCNSGTEAVMAALRFARAATGRTKFVMFEGSYHGWSDGTLALPAGAKNSIAMARGIGAGAMTDVVVLEYGVTESLKTIASIGQDLAAVLVEPVQSRRPDLQPKSFLQELRRLTLELGSALIFDEVITGFRAAPGGAQEWLGIEADLVTYGKILGGGMPIGAVAGKKRFIDTIDGGNWNYGDDSAPTSPTTFFGGTFNKNPLAMAAAEAVLTELRRQGRDLQDRIGKLVASLAHAFNTFCEEEHFPMKVVYFASLFRFIGEGEYSLQRFPLAVDLFFQMMAFRGIYILETRVCFLSASHTSEDVAVVLKTARDCLQALRRAGFFPRKVSEATLEKRPLAAMLREDAELGPDICVPVPFSGSGPPQNILLTGATGFLGAYLLRELMARTTARVYCPVRATDAGAALTRVRDNLSSYDCWKDTFSDRIVAFPADLAQHGLGLEYDAWRQLADEIDTIYHNGAQVNSLYSYDRLRAANVTGTRELLRLAVDRRVKAFHHISSDAVFDAYGYHRQATIYEDEPLAHGDSLYGGGYAETKWVAEKLVQTARARGLPAFIYRPGMITGDVERGISRIDDFFARFVKGVLQLGLAPEIDAVIDIAPVDYVSRMIVQLSGKGDVGRTFHLTHPEPVSYLQFIQYLQTTGCALRVVPYFEWERRLARLRYEDDNALYPLLPVFTDSSAPFLRKAKLDVTHARHEAPELATLCPGIRDLLALYVRKFREIGFLPAQASAPEACAN